MIGDKIQNYPPQPQPQQPGQYPEQPQYPPQYQQQQQYQQPYQQYPQQPYQQQPGMQPPMQQPGKPKNNMMIIAIIAIVVVIAVVLVAVLLMSGVSSSNTTPEGAVRASFDAMNRYDAKGVLDLSVAKFLPTPSYNVEKVSMDAAFIVLKGLGIKATVSNIVVTTSIMMSQSDINYAHSLIDNLPYQGITADVTDYCLVSYYTSLSGVYSYLNGSSEDILLQIEGKWYFAETWTYFT